MKEINLDTAYAVIALPIDAVEVNMNIGVYVNGKIIRVCQTIGLQDIHKAFEEAKNWYIPEDAQFILTEKGRKLFEGAEHGE